jgi:hypothetical protein
VLFEVKSEFLSEPQLQQIVIQRLLWDVDFASCIFQGPSLELQLPCLLIWDHDSIVELSPSAYFLNDFRNCPLLSSLFLVIGLRGRVNWHFSSLGSFALHQTVTTRACLIS